MIFRSFRCVQLNAVALIAIDVRGSLFVGNIVRAEALMTIGARKSRGSMYGRVEDLLVDVETDCFSIHLAGKSRVGMTGEAIFICARLGRQDLG